MSVPAGFGGVDVSEPIIPAMAALVAVLVAAYAHEYTHVAAFRALGGRASVRHLSLTVEWAMPEQYGTWRDRVGSLAPEMIGWTVAGVALVSNSVPAFEIETLWMFAGWAIYTIEGGLSDYSMAVARGGSLLELSAHSRQLVAGVGCCALAMAGFVFSPGPPAYTVQYLFTHLYIAIYLGGMALFALSIRNYSLTQTPATA